MSLPAACSMTCLVIFLTFGILAGPKTDDPLPRLTEFFAVVAGAAWIALIPCLIWEIWS